MPGRRKKWLFSNSDLVEALLEQQEQSTTAGEVAANGAAKSIDLMLGKPRRAYDAPDKGILWGWEVSSYVWTKAIAAGAFLVPFLAWATGWIGLDAPVHLTGIILSVLFLLFTGVLLILDLDRPDRFLYVLLRPQWNSWLVKGAYCITLYGGFLTLLALAQWNGWSALLGPAMWITAFLGIAVAAYTAFLFAQAKGRDFWQSPTLVIHMLIHSLLAGAAAFGVLAFFFANTSSDWLAFLKMLMQIGLVVNLVTILVELSTQHPTKDMEYTVHMILKGRYRGLFWGGVVLVGNLLPLLLLSLGGTEKLFLAAAGLLLLVGIYLTEKNLGGSPAANSAELITKS